MKPFRSALIYLMVAVALGAYIWFFERKPKESNVEAKVRIYDFAADDVRTLTLTNAEAKTREDRGPIVLSRDDQGAWILRSPGPYDADPVEVRNILSTLLDPGVEEVIASPPDLSEFGLAKPSASVAVGLADGRALTLFVGGRTINDQSIYVKPHDRPDVYMVNASQVSGMNRKVQELRHKVVYATGFVEARKVLISLPGRDPVVLEKKDEIWRVRTPAGKWVTADEDETRQYLNVVNGIRSQEFFDRPDLNRMGLGPKNRGTIEIWPSEKAPSVTLVLGNEVPGQDRMYLRRKDKPFAVSVIKRFAQDMDRKWSDFRDRNLMRFEAADAVKLSISKPGVTLEYVKNPEGVWTCPGRAQAADEAARILDALSALRVQSYVENMTPASAGTVNPPQSATVTLKDGKVRVFRFGRRDSDKILLASDQGPEIFLVFPIAANQIENVLTGLTAVKTTP